MQTVEKWHEVCTLLCLLIVQALLVFIFLLACSQPACHKNEYTESKKKVTHTTYTQWSVVNWECEVGASKSKSLCRFLFFCSSFSLSSQKKEKRNFSYRLSFLFDDNHAQLTRKRRVLGNTERHTRTQTHVHMPVNSNVTII